MPSLSFRRRVRSIVFLATSITAAGADPADVDRVRALIEARCLECHGPEQKLSELDLSTRQAMLTGGLRGPALLPGEATASPLYRHAAGLAEPRMPLGDELAPDDLAVLKAWIDAGAPYGDEPRAAARSASPTARETASADREWWAFRPPRRRPPPGAGHPIDAFFEAKLRAEGRSYAPEADRRTLIRRAYLDLVGLLPPVAEVEAFVQDSSPDAHERLIERLLASPRYGERWGRHWLDVVRYADSAGYEHDFDYAEAWRYRDYVIGAFNGDKPYDRFIREQLAGDELPDWDFDSLTATGFYRVGARVLYREKDNPDYRYAYLDDMIQTASRAFMGLSVECARCHDHKFDPITQLDYYRMMAIFFPQIRYDFPLAPPDVVAEHERRKAEVASRAAPLKARIEELEAPYKERRRREKLATFPEEIRVAVETPAEQRTEGQRLLADQVLTLGGGPIDELLSDADRAEVEDLRARITEIEKDLPEPLPTAMGVRDGDYRSAPDGAGDEVQPGKGDRQSYPDAGPWIPSDQAAYRPPPAHLLPSGYYRVEGPEVQPGLLSVLARPEDFQPRPPRNGRVSTGRRLALADWLASPDHPLTARVMVNRIWQHHFGAGLVATPNNFGRTGAKPTNPELLDWLATEFVRQGWSVKRMHRLIMTSRAYRTASAGYDGREGDDAWRFPIRRLEGEILRDVTLDAAGSLNLAAGGEPFFPAIPQAVRDSFLKGRWEMTSEEPATWRRGVYSYYKRGLRYPLFDVLDLPNLNVSCERRTVTTVPTQALTLLNNEFVLIQAERFARRVRAEAKDDPAAQIDRAYRIAFSRPPAESEAAVNREFLARQTSRHRAKPDPSLAALADLCDVILNLNEFVYLP